MSDQEDTKPTEQTSSVSIEVPWDHSPLVTALGLVEHLVKSFGAEVTDVSLDSDHGIFTLGVPNQAIPAPSSEEGDGGEPKGT